MPEETESRNNKQSIQTEAKMSNGNLPLNSTDLSKLENSFISEEWANKAKLFRVDSANGAKIVGKTKLNEDFSGLVFPYHSPDLQLLEYRLRRDNPPIEQKADGSQKEKDKYLSPPGKGSNLYLPPNCQKEWLDDISLPVVITEGEKKALALDRAFWLPLSDSADKPLYLALSIPGVWNFKGNIGKTTNSNGKRVAVKGLISAFQWLKWKQRNVFILFDANVKTNYSVSVARESLGKELKDLGANVFYVDLPEIPNCNGIDDVLGKIANEQSENDACQFLFNLLDLASGKESYESQFEVRPEGVYFVGSDSKGNKSNTKISSPLHILAETQSETGENYGRLVEWKDSKSRLHSWALPIELVHSESNEHIKYLVSRGLEVKPNKFSRQKLSEYIAESKPDKTVICTNKTGWNENLFVLPNETIGEIKNNQTVIFQSANMIEHRFQTKGTLKEWQENIARLCVGNSRLVFAVSVAFASCLLSPLQENGGGFHFRGASSLGKSTTLLVGGSVWGGDSRQGFLNTWRTTSNGLESVAELHNDSLLCLDELKECDPRTASETAYMLANGQGKGRMSRNIFARKSLSWVLLFLSSGELSLSDLIEQNGGRIYGGQEVRMCDISADAGKDLGLFENLHEFPTAELFAKQLSENSKKYYGLAIREFLKNVSANLEHLKNRWQVFRESFMNQVLPKDATGEVQRVASRFALVAFGGWLARDVCGWTEKEASDACKTVFKAWLNGRNGHGNTDAENAIKNVRYFLDLHGNSRFQDLDISVSLSGITASSSDPKISSRAGFKRKNSNDETEYLIFPETFTKDICKGFDARIVANELANKGFLEIGNTLKTGLLTMEQMKQSVRVENIPRKFFVINPKIFTE
jgi:uncharacterized protein (DUF927 family)